MMYWNRGNLEKKLVPNLLGLAIVVILSIACFVPFARADSPNVTVERCGDVVTISTVRDWNHRLYHNDSDDIDMPGGFPFVDNFWKQYTGSVGPVDYVESYADMVAAFGEDDFLVVRSIDYFGSDLFFESAGSNWQTDICAAPDPFCSDGVIDDGESCDDGNFDSGDGCDSACGVEVGFSCVGEPSTCSLLTSGGYDIPDMFGDVSEVTAPFRSVAVDSGPYFLALISITLTVALAMTILRKGEKKIIKTIK